MTIYTPRTPRVVAARRLHRRRDRDAAGLFLVEGPQAVREATDVVELFATEDAVHKFPEISGNATLVTQAAIEALAETQNPQGLVAVCRHRHVDLGEPPDLSVLLAGVADPGNAGTVLRTADAAGAGAVIFPEGTVDPYNAKCVRASAGSIFHLTLVRGGDPLTHVAALRDAGVTVLAADPRGERSLDNLAAVRRTAWIFGSEAHGLDADVAAAADARVRIPIYGRAESLNLAAAAAVCLYATRTLTRRGAS